VRILFPYQGSGTVCVEVDECVAHACAAYAEECIQSNRTAPVCDSLQWFVANASQNSSGTDADSDSDSDSDCCGVRSLSDSRVSAQPASFPGVESRLSTQSHQHSKSPPQQLQVEAVFKADGSDIYKSGGGGEQARDDSAVFMYFSRRALHNVSNSSTNETNGTNQSAVAVGPAKAREAGLFVRSPFCGAHSKCYNSVGSFQVRVLVCE
jgi:hypothetical protein